MSIPSSSAKSIIVPTLFALALGSGCGGGGGGGNRGNPTPVPGSMQFQNASLAVDENAGVATVTITRTGGSDGAVSVTLASSDGSATAAQDYTRVSTTVSFAAGDAAPKTVSCRLRMMQRAKRTRRLR